MTRIQFNPSHSLSWTYLCQLGCQPETEFTTFPAPPSDASLSPDTHSLLSRKVFYEIGESFYFHAGAMHLPINASKMLKRSYRHVRPNCERNSRELCMDSNRIYNVPNWTVGAGSRHRCYYKLGHQFRDWLHFHIVIALMAMRRDSDWYHSLSFGEIQI